MNEQQKRGWAHIQGNISTRAQQYQKDFETTYKEAFNTAEAELADELKITLEELRTGLAAYRASFPRGKQPVTKIAAGNGLPSAQSLMDSKAVLTNPPTRKATAEQMGATKLYRAWVAENDHIPSDKAVGHFMGKSQANAIFSYARSVLREEGYTIEASDHNGWIVLARPAVAPLVSEEELAAFRALAAKLRKAGHKI